MFRFSQNIGAESVGKPCEADFDKYTMIKPKKNDLLTKNTTNMPSKATIKALDHAQMEKK